jgi:hypothetical protein
MGSPRGGVASGAEKQSKTAVNHSNAPVSALSANQQPPAGEWLSVAAQNSTGDVQATIGERVADVVREEPEVAEKDVMVLTAVRNAETETDTHE